MFPFPSPRIRTKDLANPPLPDGYTPYLTHAAYLAREVAAQPSFHMVTAGDSRGVTWHYGPFHFERYVGDAEPAYTQEGPFRLATWQRIERKDQPHGWRETGLVMATSRTGFSTLSGSPDYAKTWSTHAQRHRKTWLKKTDWEIVTISMEDYLAAFKRAKMDLFLKFMFTNLLKQKVKGHGELVHIVGARITTPNSPIEAGFAFVHVPETRQAIHLVAFHTDVAKAHSVGVGLMDYWHQWALAANVRFLEFGMFWTPGEPNSWKGFSQFKSQFGLQFHDYPRPLMRWVGKRSFGHSGA